MIRTAELFNLNVHENCFRESSVMPNLQLRVKQRLQQLHQMQSSARTSLKSTTKVFKLDAEVV